jgi:hypothetical protein
LDIKLRVPAWVRKGYTVRVNGEEQAVDAVPGTYLTLSRRWRSGDTVEVEMPFSFWTNPTLDDPAIQSIYYGPTLMAVQADPVGDALDSGLIPVSLYRHMKLDGDLAAAMTPAGEPMHFVTNGLTLAPFHIADPVPAGYQPSEEQNPGIQQRGRRGPPTQPYHLYVRRREPEIVFGSEVSGVTNAPGPDGRTFLDAVWRGAPFGGHQELLAALERVAEEWEGRGALTQQDRTAILEAARRAEAELRA